MSQVFCNLSINGTLSNAVVETSPPGSSWIVHIDGSDNSFVDFGTAIGQFKTNDFTVAFWFQTTETHRLFDVAGNRTAGSHGNFFIIRMTGNHESMAQGTVYVEVDQNNKGLNYNAVHSSVAGLNDGQWHHIATVRKGKLLQLYVDGVLSNSQSVKGVANINNRKHFILGRSLSGHETKFAADSRYSDLRVYDIALTEEQISSLFSSSGPFERVDNTDKDDATDHQTIDANDQDATNDQSVDDTDKHTTDKSATDNQVVTNSGEHKLNTITTYSGKNPDKIKIVEKIYWTKWPLIDD